MQQKLRRGRFLYLRPLLCGNESAESTRNPTNHPACDAARHLDYVR